MATPHNNSNRRSPKGRNAGSRRHPSDQTARYVDLGIRSLSTSLTSKYGPAAAMPSDDRADVKVMAQYNALRGFEYVARSGGVVLATWSLAVNHLGYKVIWPTKLPSSRVLRACGWAAVVRQDPAIQPAYQHLLRGRWSTFDAARTDTLTGTVHGIASYGQPAKVISGNRTYELRLAEAKVHQTRPGDVVQFVPQTHQGRAVAHLTAVLQRAS